MFTTQGTPLLLKLFSCLKYSSVLDIGSKAKIEATVNHVRPEIGLSTRLECPVTGNPKPKVTWWRDGTDLSDSRSKKVKRDGNSLILNNVEMADDGVYTCKADNRYGSTSHDVLITVRVSSFYSLQLQFLSECLHTLSFNVCD